MLVAVASLAALALVVLCPITFLYLRQQEQARAQFAPPTVFITEPAYGVVAPTGSYITVSATASGHAPITRAELWVDGELVETEQCEQPEGISPFGAHFALLVPEGPHMLFVRAVNIEGIIGQSLPVGVVGEAGPREALLAVTVEQGQTLADIANSYDTDSATLQELNPELGVQEPISGTEVIVPAPPDTVPPGPAAPAVGPALPPGPSAPPGTGPVPVPDVPPLKPIAPGPAFPSTVPLPIIGVQIFPVVVIPNFQPPAAPTNLQGSVENCMVRLRWTDNSTNELSYDLWTAPMGGSKRLITSLQPAGGGPAWVEFPAPLTGGLSFWVEAVGLGGKQPSNIVWVEVDPQCPTTLPSQLQVEVLDMTVRSGYDRAYCYVSLEDAPEVRIPDDDSEFVRVQGGRGDIATSAAGSRKFAVPIPGDESLEIAGECWGWSGDQLENLGTFSGGYPRETWDGTKRPLEGGTYEIGVALDTFGGEKDGGDMPVTYAYEDPTMPVPYDLREERVGSESSLDTLAEWEWFWQRRLSWKWSGDPKKLTGFQIYLDGKAYQFVKAEERAAVVTLPVWCGPSLPWEVTAAAGSAESRLSVPVQSDLPKCTRYGRVKFDKIYWTYTNDTWYGGDCDECQAYGEIGLDIGGRRVRQGCAVWWLYRKVKCGNYRELSGLCSDQGRGGWRDSYPEGPDDMILNFYEDGAQDIVFEVFVKFWDHDMLTGDDYIANYAVEHRFSDLKAAQSALGCGKQFMASDCSGDGCSRLWYTLYVYPNACQENPP